jgi:hypothetical protein
MRPFFAYGTFTLYRLAFQKCSAKFSHSFGLPYNPEVKDFGLGSSLFARRYFGNL